MRIRLGLFFNFKIVIRQWLRLMKKEKLLTTLLHFYYTTIAYISVEFQKQNQLENCKHASPDKLGTGYNKDSMISSTTPEEIQHEYRRNHIQQI